VRLPLPALLAQVLVAFTVELDNEFERHTYEALQRRFRLSLVMWSNFMRYVGPQGISLHALAARSRDPLAGQRALGLERWGYITIAPPRDERGARPAPDWFVRATAAGRRAQAAWERLLPAIERRWGTRFGTAAVTELREALAALVVELDPSLPDYVPIVGYGMFARERPAVNVSMLPADGAAAGRTLPALLSKALLAFTLDFERGSDVSLTIAADVLRLIDRAGVRVGDLPRLGGVSKEAIAMALSFLRARGFATVETDRAVRRKVARLTPAGESLQAAARSILQSVENGWSERFGTARIERLRAALERLASAPPGEAAPLWQGLEPPAGCWRAGIPRPEVLPRYPMVLHRGGWPDGS
jgi:DNA-binding MarR family transcriptional regulator